MTMKSTLKIGEHLICKDKSFTVQRDISMRYVYKQTSIALLNQTHQSTQTFTLRNVSVDGQGLQAGVDLSDTAQWHGLIYATP